ncbi:MAG: type II secretion system protein GspL [Gammaproteobacteria bacterium]|nr:type II secretion system protein GspL [Gammaproteobacteria bacterium]MBU2478811.1 type II secretion system protein GspL [Gammaproteobacteria bacterium]
MRETLLIRFAEHSADGVDFVRLDEAGKPVAESQHGSLTEAAMLAAGLRVVVLVPAADLLLARAAVPTNNRQRARKAVPFALEEQLAEDVDALHFALGVRDSDGQWPVAVVAQARMDDWLAQLNEAGILPDRLLPESTALPLEPGSSSLLLEADRVLLREQPWSAQIATPETLPVLLDMLVARSEAGVDLQVWHCGGELPVWMEPVSARIEPCKGGALAVLAKGLVAADAGVDLLQGAYSRKEQYGRLWRPWRAAAVLMLVGALVSAVQQGLHYRSLKAESATLTTQIEQIYQQAMPGGRMVNPRVQMEQQLNSLRRQQGAGSTDFLGLIGQMGGVFSATPGVELSAASFRDGRLDLELTANDVQTLDRLKQQLTEQGGLSVEIQSATTGANQRVQGRLRIEGAPS